MNFTSTEVEMEFIFIYRGIKSNLGSWRMSLFFQHLFWFALSSIPRILYTWIRDIVFRGIEAIDI